MPIFRITLDTVNRELFVESDSSSHAQDYALSTYPGASVTHCSRVPQTDFQDTEETDETDENEND